MTPTPEDLKINLEAELTSCGAFVLTYDSWAALHALAGAACRRALAAEAELAGINRWVNDEIQAKTESLQRSFVTEAERRMDAQIALADVQRERDKALVRIAELEDALAEAEAQVRAVVPLGDLPGVPAWPAESDLYRVRVAALEAELASPCRDCGHRLDRHQAQEGMCLDCPCMGWTAEKGG